jgi:excisionase family DNA binding protein
MRLLSPRELAQALGVSESSLKRWVDAGKIVASRTDGGHRKIALPEAVRFIRETGAPLAHPEVLDLPALAAARPGAATADDGLLGHLERGEAQAARGWLVTHYLAGASIAELADGPVRAAMHALGELWRHDERGVFIEHRATEACLAALGQLRSALDEPAATAPLALGGAPEDDPYRLPTLLASMVAAEAGLRAINLGPDTPIAALHHAIAEHHPRLVWLSATGRLAPHRARDVAHWIAGLPRTVTVVVGGRSAGALAAAHPAVRHVETMSDLAVIARRLAAGARPAVGSPP